MNNIILGAGITGLSAGIKTGFPIYESKDKPGGICRSYNIGKYKFEIGGGHWLFGVNDDVYKFISKYSELSKYERKAGVYINHIFTAPIQNYLTLEEPLVIGTMQHWLRSKFSAELCKLFFYPFNRKYTDNLYTKILPEDNYKTPNINDKIYNETFYYPSLGLNNLVDGLADKLKIYYNKEVVYIDIKEKKIYFKDGEKRYYDRIISTLPLREIQNLCGFKDWHLPFTSVKVINIGGEEGKNCPKDHWLYIPFCKYGFFRVGFYSNVNQSFVNNATFKTSIYVEKSYSQQIEDIENYSELVVEELKDWGFIRKPEVVDENYIKYAYTWRYKESEVDKYISILKNHGIESIGRYGRWKFQGIAESILDGLSVLL